LIAMDKNESPEPYYRVEHREDFGVGPMPWEPSRIGWRNEGAARAEAMGDRERFPHQEIRLVRVAITVLEVFPPKEPKEF
jgi:hypothetical protein